MVKHDREVPGARPPHRLTGQTRQEQPTALRVPPAGLSCDVSGQAREPPARPTMRCHQQAKIQGHPPPKKKLKLLIISKSQEYPCPPPDYTATRYRVVPPIEASFLPCLKVNITPTLKPFPSWMHSEVEDCPRLARSCLRLQTNDQSFPEERILKVKQARLAASWAGRIPAE